MKKRSVAAAVLCFEAIVLMLAIPVAITVADIDKSLALPLGIALVLLCFVAAGMLRTPRGYAIGWAVQVLAVALGFVIPVMFVLGLLFGLLWFITLRLGKVIEREQAAREVAQREWDAAQGAGPGPKAEPGET